MLTKNTNYDFSTKEAQYLLKTFSEEEYKILEYLEYKDKLILEKDNEIMQLNNAINDLVKDNEKLNTIVCDLDRQLGSLIKFSKTERYLKGIYRIIRKILRKVYNLLKRIYHLPKKVFRKRD